MIPRGRALERASLLVGGLALLACALLGLASPARFFVAYRFSLFFWLGLSLGGLTWLALHFLVGGAWGAIGRACFEASGRMIGWTGLLFVPLLLGLGFLYPWARPEEVARSALLQHREAYLSVPSVVIRSVLYLALWTGFARRITTLSRRLDTEPSVLGPLQRSSTAWLLVYLFTASWAAIDWIASSEPRWSSSIFGLLTMSGQLLSAMALSAFGTGLLSRMPTFRELAGLSRHLNDLGNLLLTGVMTWGYLEFVQLLIVWGGNLPDEASWYALRVGGAWRWVAWTLFGLQFALPFILLLFRGIKRHPGRLAGVGALVLVAHVVYGYWQLVPPSVPEGPLVHPLDVLALIGVGGLWTGGFLWHLNRRPHLVPADRRLGTEVGHA